MLPPFTVLWSFALIVALLAITPGIDTALVLRTAALNGRRRAFGTIAGIQTGVLIWGMLAAAGVSALLLASSVAYDAVRIAGALYLLWIGGRMLWSAIRGRGYEDIETAVPSNKSASFLSGWRQGAITNLLNPKVGAFYVALLPQFIPTAAPHLLWGASLALVHIVIGTVWLTFLTLVAHRFQVWLRKRRVARTVDGIAGVAIAGFGTAILVESAR